MGPVIDPSAAVVSSRSNSSRASRSSEAIVKPFGPGMTMIGAGGLASSAVFAGQDRPRRVCGRRTTCRDVPAWSSLWKRAPLWGLADQGYLVPASAAFSAPVTWADRSAAWCSRGNTRVRFQRNVLATPAIAARSAPAWCSRLSPVRPEGRRCESCSAAWWARPPRPAARPCGPTLRSSAACGRGRPGWHRPVVLAHLGQQIANLRDLRLRGVDEQLMIHRIGIDLGGRGRGLFRVAGTEQFVDRDRARFADRRGSVG